jgi:hypothetical protein
MGVTTYWLFRVGCRFSLGWRVPVWGLWTPALPTGLVCPKPQTLALSLWGMWTPALPPGSRCHMIPARDVSEQDQEAAASVPARPVTYLRLRR